MKLRLRDNGLRLRLNRPEVENLAAGGSLQERVHFPGSACLSYVLENSRESAPSASFRNGVIRVSAPGWQLKDWAKTEAIGFYFQVPGDDGPLKVAIEKDLECIEAQAEERDPQAFPRTVGKNC